MNEEIENKKLIEKYPFLLPRNVWTNEIENDYDYSYTFLDELPEGWVKAFGIQLCEEIKNELIEAEKNRIETLEERKEFAEWYGFKENEPDDYLHIWQIIQWKEKFGELRLYPNFTTDNLDDIIDKYTELSKITCGICGKTATRIGISWIFPYCDECSNNIETISIKRYFEGE